MEAVVMVIGHVHNGIYLRNNGKERYILVQINCHSNQLHKIL